MILKAFNKKTQYDFLNEFEKIKLQLYCADNEFNNAADELHIKAAIFRICEIETRRDLALKRLKEVQK